MEQAAKLSIKALSKSFGDLEVLRDIDAEIAHGEFISLVGPSGCGKTTLLRIVAGLEAASTGAACSTAARCAVPAATAASCSRATTSCRGAACSTMR